MQLVIFLTIAVLALGFLIVFNMRAMKSNKRMQSDKNPIDSAQTGFKSEIKETELVETNGDTVPPITKYSDKKPQMDTDYRRALRGFAKENNEETNKIVENNSQLSPDQAYREALRTMEKHE